MNFRVSQFDPYVFIHTGHLLIVAIWVDDLLIASKDEKVARDFRYEMSKKFDMKDEGKCTYYLGMNIEQTDQGIYVHQKRYAERILARFGLQDMATSSTPLPPKTALKENTGQTDPHFKEKYQSLVGCLMWLSNQTRPDLSFPVNYVARYTANPAMAHMEAALHIYSYVAGTTQKGMRYVRTGQVDVECYSDSDYAQCIDTRCSITGNVFLIV